MGSIFGGLKIGFFRASCFGFRVKGVCPLLLPLVSLAKAHPFNLHFSGTGDGDKGDPGPQGPKGEKGESAPLPSGPISKQKD